MKIIVYIKQKLWYNILYYLEVTIERIIKSLARMRRATD